MRDSDKVAFSEFRKALRCNGVQEHTLREVLVGVLLASHLNRVKVDLKEPGKVTPASRKHVDAISRILQQQSSGVGSAETGFLTAVFEAAQIDHFGRINEATAGARLVAMAAVCLQNVRQVLLTHCAVRDFQDSLESRDARLGSITIVDSASPALVPSLRELLRNLLYDRFCHLVHFSRQNEPTLARLKESDQEKVFSQTHASLHEFSLCADSDENAEKLLCRALRRLSRTARSVGASIPHFFPPPSSDANSEENLISSAVEVNAGSLSEAAIGEIRRAEAIKSSQKANSEMLRVDHASGSASYLLPGLARACRLLQSSTFQKDLDHSGLNVLMTRDSGSLFAQYGSQAALSEETFSDWVEEVRIEQ
jgi:hypothetical protein